MKPLNKIFIGWMLGAVLVAPAVAATDNGCSDPENNYVNPMVALCSTHVYNIGGMENPDNFATRQMMNDVVALKSTIIAQQMKKQYDYLDATIRRLKTQLEKAVLTSALETAGAPSDNGGGGGTGDRNIYLSGTNNCNNQNTTAEVYSCLRTNYNTIYNMSNGGTNINADLRQQLAKDYAVMTSNANGIEDFSVSPAVVDGKTIDCTKTSGLSRNNFIECLESLNTNIRSATGKINQSKNTNQWGMMMNQGH